MIPLINAVIKIDVSFTTQPMYTIALITDYNSELIDLIIMRSATLTRDR